MRLTRTHSGPDSKGVVRFGRWEFEGESYLYVVVGCIAGVLVYAVAAAQATWVRLSLAMLPLALALAWIKTFVLGKPPHHLGDQVERWTVGPHFGIGPKCWSGRRHPRENALQEERSRLCSKTS